MPKRIAVNGTTYVVPDDATDDEITQIVDSSQNKTASSGGDNMEAADQFKRQAYSNAWENLKAGHLGEAAHSLVSLFNNPNAGDNFDITKGVAKGAGQTAHTIGAAASRVIPGVGSIPFQQPDYLQPQNTGQKVGAGAEQMLEMAATGGPLRAGAEALATKLPFLGRFAAPLLRIGAEAANTGTSAALHDQPVGTSAAVGAGGAALSEGLQAIAPKIAESALGVTQRLRGHGRTIGEAALNETSAIRPGTMARQAGDQLGDLTNQL